MLSCLNSQSLTRPNFSSVRAIMSLLVNIIRLSSSFSSRRRFSALSAALSYCSLSKAQSLI